ncbi:hypothetical protein ACHLD2_004888, partial [Escherichia coli]
MKINYGAFVLLPHNTVTNHLHVMRQKASSAGHIIAHIPARWPHSLFLKRIRSFRLREIRVIVAASR